MKKKRTSKFDNIIDNETPPSARDTCFNIFHMKDRLSRPRRDTQVQAEYRYQRSLLLNWNEDTSSSSEMDAAPTMRVTRRQVQFERLSAQRQTRAATRQQQEDSSRRVSAPM